MRLATFVLACMVSLLAYSLVWAQEHASKPGRAPFSPLPPLPPGDADKIALGRALFYDPRMSRSMNLSCSSCHDLSTNGASSARFDRGDTAHTLRFNTPTVFNSVYSFRLGWEGGHRSLHDLALGALESGHVMSSWGLATKRFAADAKMTTRFLQIYGNPPREENMADALSAFMATLVTPDAPFDRWLRGDPRALTAQQVRGYERFRFLGCASCHQGVNVGGNIFQRRGIFHPLQDKHPQVLRVPSLRNVAVTSPYFHDGSVASLPEAIRKMAHSQLDLEIGEPDLRDISAFLDSLTGTYQGHPLRPATHGAP